MTTKNKASIVFLLAALAVPACSKNDPSSEQTAPPAPAGTGGAETRAMPVPVTMSVIGVDIDTKLAAMCGLPQSKAFFEFDSAQLGAEAKDLLQQLASCAKSGPARGERLRIVGRADPVGTDEYNQKLGMSRAESVSRYLEELGVEHARLQTESKGESEAGPDPYGWPYERRVTIRLAS